MPTSNDAALISNKAAEHAEREFIKGTGYGLTDDEMAQLRNAIYAVLNAAIRKTRTS